MSEPIRRSSLATCSLAAVAIASLLSATGQARACDAHAPVCGASPDAAARRLIEAQAWAALPAEHRAAIAAAGGAPAAPEFVGPPEPDPTGDLEPLGDEAYEQVREVVSREAWGRMKPIHQRMLARIMERHAAGERVPALCFTPGTPRETVEAFNAALEMNAIAFQQTDRWSSTAMTPGPLAQGDQVVLTYSFPPDGTFCPDLIGVTGNNNLNAFMNGIYGSPEVWRAIYAEVFARWSELIGTTYVYEPNDDGSPLHGAPGVVGVRGDLRLAGIPIDGNSGTLAYNNFPQDGDMVIDTADNFFTGSSGQANNNRGLRNVLAHEHGHGMGMLHVCPANETKLMEPYISVAYDGPQLDDVLNGQRHYGDALEPNDTVAEAYALEPATTDGMILRGVSVDDNEDADVFAVAVEQPGLLRATVRPTGATYLNGGQTFFGCSSGSSYDSLRRNTVGVEILDAEGRVLASAHAGALGAGATAEAPAASAGTLYVRVLGGNANDIQAYELEYQLDLSPRMVLASGDVPSIVSPNEPTSFGVVVGAINDDIVPGSAQLFYDYDGDGAFESASLAPTGEPGAYAASLPPAPCGADVRFYVAVEGVGTGPVTLPEGAPAQVFEAVVASAEITVMDDDVEQDLGWQLGRPGDTATSGQWVRAVPVGTEANGKEVQPSTDYSADGTFCFVTGNGVPGGASGSADVDGGFTTLVSPVFDVAGLEHAVVSYARWYSNSEGAAPGTDTFRVEISNDGGSSWATLEVVGPTGEQTQGGWFHVTHRIADVVAPTASVRVRFIADDAGAGSLVEAAVDEFFVGGLECIEEPACPADRDGDGAATVQDLIAYLQAFGTGDGDMDGSGDTTVQDLIAYLQAFATGC